MVNFSIVPCFLLLISATCCSATKSTKSATCPEDQSIIEPCTCISSSNSLDSTISLPNLSCINFNGGANSSIPLDDISKKLSDYLTSAGQSTELDRLLVVNGQMKNLSSDHLGSLHYRYLSIYETNLTTVAADAFTVS